MEQSESREDRPLPLPPPPPCSQSAWGNRLGVNCQDELILEGGLRLREGFSEEMTLELS